MRIRQCSDEVICARTATPLNLKAIGRNDQRSTIALNLGYFFDLPHLSMKMHGNVIDFKVFMEQVVGVPKGAALVDSQFGAQTSFWLNNMQRWQHEQGQPGPRPNTEIVYRAVDDSEEIGFNGDISEQGPKFQDIQLETHGTSIRRVRREKWDLVDQDELSVIDNLVRNGLVDSVEAAKASDRIYTNTDGESSFKVRRSFYAFADVRGGGLDRIVEWSLNFKYTPEDINQIMHKGKPLLGKDSCRPPKEGPQVNKIPWEARFPAFATCRIENYVGIKQELDDFHEQIISIEGQFHTTGWIPIIYSSLENANKYRTIATTFLQYAPAVHEAADYLMKRLKDMVLARHSQHLTSSNNPHEGKPDSSWLLLSMHVRRGDFITDKYGWQEFSDTWMKSLVKNAVDTVFSPEPSISSRLPPNIGFYMATDESSPWVIDYFHSLGAILFEDLTDGPFEKRFAQLIVYDDWIGLVEQLICAKAKRFYGTMTSSFTSGIVNMRLGMDQSQDDGPSQTNFEYLIKEGGPVLTDAQEEFGM
ncbi:hypothetical protein BGX27_002251 [Mortierella sp. AM989]|nr:hypothetical protein BGX27_002251 [Mortierella sp. AM989]